jgi:uncharacterized protein (DUF697 family)
MSKKKARPAFNLPSTSKPGGSDWVYRSDDAAPEPAKPVAAAKPAVTAKTAAAAKPAPALPRPVAAKHKDVPHSEKIVMLYSQYAAAAGLIPLPGIDFAAVGALQLRMIAELAAHYGVPFNHQVGRSLLATMVGGFGAAKLSYALGPVIGIVAKPGAAFGATWAIGKLFVSHFESGGTLTDFSAKSHA